MNKIVYLFGAGASAEALPVVNKIPESIRAVINLLKDEKFELSKTEKFENVGQSINEPKDYYFQELIRNLEWVLNECEKHASIDTYAKKLIILGKRKELERLKASLSVFFVILQTLNNPDKRYDSFFASIMDSRGNFPSNLKIISWNYDYQFELSYLEYSDHNEIISAQRRLNISHKYGDFNDYDGFNIYKINGTTGFYSEGGWNQHMYNTDFKSDVDNNFIENITKNYAVALYHNSTKTNFSFAWEFELQENSIVELAIKNTQDATTLVIIGYSFPFFNREIDRKIIGSMENLKSVYFQCPDADIILERFKAIKDDISNLELNTKFDLDQFVLPNEM